MRLHERNRRSHAPAVDGLESRGLLSAGGSAALAAAVREIPGLAAPVIRGTISGTVTAITPISSTSERVSYTALGKASIIGDGTGSGGHTITSRPLKDGSTADAYKAGSATIQGTTDRVAIRYTGAGHTAADGTWTATWKGTARSVAGLHAGLGGAFTAQLSGSSRSGPFTINLTIRL